MLRLNVFALMPLGLITAFSVTAAESAPAIARGANTTAQLYPLSQVRLLDSPFTEAVKANRSYLLAHDADRLLAPFLREAGLEMRAKSYPNWESSGLDGHTAGHYIAALATMIASGSDTKEHEFQRRLDYMLDELGRCQKANGNGYIGGVPGSREFWADVAAGHMDANGFRIQGKWVPWYNLHKTFVGLRDAYLVTGNVKAREILVRFGDWCVQTVSGLSDEQMQNMLKTEHGGMNEVMADIYAITGDEKYLRTAQRFCHKAVLEPLEHHEDRLTGLHANTQIPKVIGLERIATLTGDKGADSGARYFWENVTGHRSVAFGGNSVSEHFNDPKNFKGVLESREGPETCNTYNMLRLTEQLFASEPKAAYADYYERALYNHILASINPVTPGYVYFTPIRPAHYRVYSQPEKGFWCCVGTGMENPGKYGEFIYARATNGIYVNLFIPSELTETNLGLTLRQETKFPDEPRTGLVLKLKKRTTFALHIRNPGWVAPGGFEVRVNGKVVKVESEPSSYAEVKREWRDGDRVEIRLPMRTTVERLPDGSDWVALLRGPIVLASPAGTNDLTGLRADDSRMGHVAHGPTVSLDKAPVLLASAEELPGHVKADGAPMHFRIVDVAQPSAPNGLPLMPFFRLHDQRYQMYWQLATSGDVAERRERVAVAEREKEAREAATLDSVAIGEQQPEVEHNFAEGKTGTGMRDGRRWRRGNWFQYSLNTRGANAADVVVTYWGGERDCNFDILANGTVLATENFNRPNPGKFFEKRYAIPSEVLAAATNGSVTVKFAGKPGEATAGIFELRLVRPQAAAQ